MSDPPLTGHPQIALIRLNLMQKQLKKGRFTHTIRADQCDFLAGMDPGARTIEKAFGTTLKTDIFDTDHGRALCPNFVTHDGLNGRAFIKDTNNIRKPR